MINLSDTFANSIASANSDETYPRPKKHFVPPPIIGTYYEYIDVNKDKELRKSITNFFYKKINKWISSYPDFTHLKSYSAKFKTKQGYNLVYNIIRKFTKENNINWFDLKDYYNIFKEYIKYNLLKFIKIYL